MKRAHPLQGRSIVVTRAADDSAELRRLLEGLGAEVILMPTVAFAPPEDWQELDEQLHRLDEFDAIVFLSKNAARYIFDRCVQLGIQCEVLGASNRLIAAVGKATAKALTEKGLRVDYVGRGTGASLIKELRKSLSGRRVLLPRSDRRDDRVPSALRGIGAEFTEVIAYRTTPALLKPAAVAKVRAGEVDAIVFASPSAFYNLRDSLGAPALREVSAEVDFIAIGPTTSRAIREFGAPIAVEATEASADGLVAALAKHYVPESPTSRPV